MIEGVVDGWFRLFDNEDKSEKLATRGGQSF